MTPDLLNVTAQLFTAFVLLFGRVIGLVSGMPLFGERTVPWQPKVGLSLFITLLLLPLAQARMPLPTNDLLILGLGFARELLLGLSLGYMGRLMFGGFQFAVNALDFQSGLSFAEAVNPAADANMSVMGQFLNTLMLLLFLELDGHHILLRALGATLTAQPLGYAAPPLPTADLIASLFGQFVTFGIQLALPAVLLLLLIDIAMGLIGRVVPQLNVFLVALPVKIMVMVFTLGFTLPVASDIMGRLLAILTSGLSSYIGMMR